jgi:hypothetical protein
MGGLMTFHGQACFTCTQQQRLESMPAASVCCYRMLALNIPSQQVDAEADTKLPPYYTEEQKAAGYRLMASARLSCQH